MRATRLRLRFVPGVSVSAATYGSGNYGTQTYGQSATDPLAAFSYRVVPLPTGAPAAPAWIYRQGDVSTQPGPSGPWPTWRAQLFGQDVPLDLTPIDTATLVLTPHDGRDLVEERFSMALDVQSATLGIVTGTWVVGHLPEPGTYRVAIVLRFDSARRLTIPGDDLTTLAVVSGG